ncbi:Aurofusarin cluster transcription factor aurR2 [Apiospora phragmitis]|uniref:Aurofusarin cluster transcription factor aurR2 n=1 Tax=Apiospora phragmitis TaxID=2905665 RepID=A0ABR1X578_9PEZI
MSDTADSTLGDGDSYRQTTPSGPSAPQQSQPISDMTAAMKVTRGHSCILCQQRKVRCDKSKPCSNCVKAGVECRVVPPQPPRRRKKRVPERDLVDRLRKYEAMLTQHGIEFEGLGPDVKILDPGTVQEGDELDSEFIKVRESPARSDPELISSPGETPHIPRTFKWFPFQKEFRAIEEEEEDEAHRESSDDDDVGTTINTAYDKMFDNADGFPFVMTHTPTLQGRIIEASANLGKTSKSLEALMFAIYLMAVTSLQDDEVLEMFNEERAVLLKRYYIACQQALLNASFMRNPDLTILQAYTLYLFDHSLIPGHSFCLTGIGIRLAWRMGLHRDGQQFNLSPFEVEERRRLWWTLAGFDRRIGEITGSTLTAISTGGDCKLPLNINDADLHLHAKDSPVPHTGATEMIFSLTRLEFSKAPGVDKMKPVISDPAQPVANLADHRLSSYLERLSTHMEDTYLKFCDPKVPLHYFTLMMTRVSMCKLKVLAGFFKTAMQTPAPLSPFESEALFIEAIKLLEYDSTIHANDSLKGYFWFSALHFPFPAYICLVKDLRTRTTGELCERAWAAIFENHECRQLLRQMRSPMQLAFSPLFVKAWDAREAAESQLGRTLAPPPLITAMRQIVARMGFSAKSKSPEPSGSHPTPPSTASPSVSSAYSVPPAPASAPPAPVATQPPPPPMFPSGPDLWSNVHGPNMGGRGHYPPEFNEVNLGGEFDWQAFLSQFSNSYIPPQEMAIPTAPPDPTTQVRMGSGMIYATESQNSRDDAGAHRPALAVTLPLLQGHSGDDTAATTKGKRYYDDDFDSRWGFQQDIKLGFSIPRDLDYRGRYGTLSYDDAEIIGRNMSSELRLDAPRQDTSKVFLFWVCFFLVIILFIFASLHYHGYLTQGHIVVG